MNILGSFVDRAGGGGEVPPRIRLKMRLLSVLIATWLLSLALYLADVNTGDARRVSTIRVPDLPSASLRRAPYSEWVHRHWVRVSGSDMSVLHGVLDEYLRRGIDVGAIVVDAGWSLEGLKEHVARLKRRAGNMRVVVFLSALVPEGSAMLKDAEQRKLLLADGRVATMPATATRPEARGALLDYSNPAAVKWWHAHLDAVLQLGIDGYKNEATDAAFAATFGGAGAVGKGGHVDRQQWGHAMYHDAFDYGRKVRGFDFATMFRPVDSIGPSVLQSFGPQDISFASWVGDHAISFSGLRESLSNALHSARRGYINIGTSIGGAATALTSGLDDSALLPADVEALTAVEPAALNVTRCLRHSELFLRWAQLGSVMAIFENGGLGTNHLPWQLCSQYGVETPSLVATTYGTLARLHDELAPYFHAVGSRTFYELHHSGLWANYTWRPLNETNGVTHLAVTPLHDGELQFSHPEDWEFAVGTDIFVAPIIKTHFVARRGVSATDDALRTCCVARNRLVRFPRFGGQQWTRLLYSPDDADVFTPGARVELDVPLDGPPLVFRRRGAIIPMTLRRLAGSGHAQLFIDRPQQLRMDAFREQRGLPPQLAAVYPPNVPVEYAIMHGEHDQGLIVSYTTTPVMMTGSPRAFEMQLRLTKHTKPLLVAIRGVRCLSCGASEVGGFSVVRGNGETILRELQQRGRRVVVVVDPAAPGSTSAEVWIFDPFATLGNLITLGPFEAT